MRSWLPRHIGGILWFGNDDPNMVAFTPVYCNSTERPVCYNTPGADGLNYSDDNAFWLCNAVSNFVYPRYSQMFGSLEQVRDSLEKSYFDAQSAVEAKAAAMSTEAAIVYLNNYGNEKAQQMMTAWKNLRNYLIVKYNDMIVRPEKDGKFTRTKYGLPSRVARPGYPESYARKLIKDTGDKFVQPE